ncbi:MAG TPA: glycosyl hydrolase, partial [Campylobacterales bacterium]|nr:glycosyl hydrolase [Campylobacterales bacterium]
PYKGLMVEGKVDTIMVAHVFNATLDSIYPATLSESTINGLLRGELGYDGVTITDDLQMGAITKKYTLDETLKLAINAGNDILLFGNQLSVNSMVSTDQLINSVKQMVKEGAIDLSTIEKSNERIERLKERL